MLLHLFDTTKATRGIAFHLLFLMLFLLKTDLSGPGFILECGIAELSQRKLHCTNFNRESYVSISKRFDI